MRLPRIPGLGPRRTIEQIAHDFGMTYTARIDRDDREPRGMCFEDPCKDVVQTIGEPYVQFGNTGWKYWVGDDDFKPSRRGYIAIRHELVLPRLVLETRSGGALSPLNVASNVLTVLSAFDENRDSVRTPVRAFADKATELTVPSGLRMRAWGAKEQAKDAAGLLAVAPTSALHDLASSFDVDIREGWVVAFSTFGDLSTDDPEIWEWAFASASRLIDLLRVWGDPDFGQEWAHYTPESVQRPASLDGSLRVLARPIEKRMQRTRRAKGRPEES